MKNLSVILFFCFLFSSKLFAGGVSIDFEIVNEKMEIFANEFIKEMEKSRPIIVNFKKIYEIKGYFGSVLKNNEKVSAIGIFVDKEEKPVAIIFSQYLISQEEIRKRAKKTAEKVLEYLLIKENKSNEKEI